MKHTTLEIVLIRALRERRIEHQADETGVRCAGLIIYPADQWWTAPYVVVGPDGAWTFDGALNTVDFLAAVSRRETHKRNQPWTS